VANNFGLKTQRMSSTKWGGGSLIPGGGIEFHQVNLNNDFKVVDKPKTNIKVDKPYDYHISK
jgi:hypothetical protein